MEQIKRITGDSVHLLSVHGDKPLKLSQISVGGGGSRPHYHGQTEFTPSTVTQTAQTEGLIVDSDITVNAMPIGSAKTPTVNVEANPTITMDGNGLVTASYSKTESITPSVTAGYVSAGTSGNVTFRGSSTYQLPSQAATAITPTESAQTAVAAGKYTTGAITVNAIPSNYIGSAVPSGSLSVSGSTVTAATGYYPSAVSESVAAGDRGAGTVSRTKSGGYLSTNISFPDATAGWYNTIGTASAVQELENKTVTPTTTSQTVTPTDTNYYLESVKINPIPPEYIIPSGTKTITSNGTGIDVSTYEFADVETPPPVLESKSITLTPSTASVSSSVTYDAGYDGLSQVDVNVDAVPTATVTTQLLQYTVGNYYRFRPRTYISPGGYVDEGYKYGADVDLPTVPSGMTVDPSATAQTIGGSSYYMLGPVTVNAISPTYVGSGITRRTASDLTESDGIVTAPSGYYENQVTKSITLVPYAIRPDAEHLQTYTYDKYAVADEGLTLPAYATSAQTIKAAANLTPTITVDMNNYRYFVVERFLSIPEYSVTSKGKGRAEYTWCSYFYEVTRAAANEFPTIIDPTKKITSAQILWASNQLYHLLYWTSSSAIALYATNGYGVYQTPSTPSLSGTTLTLKSPVLGARGSTTYFTSTYMNALTDIRYQYVIDVYRAPLNALGIYSWGQDTMLQHLIGCIDDTNHKLT